MPGQRRTAQRQHVGGAVSRAQALEVTREHPIVREHVMREEHGLGLLHVRVARHDDAKVVLGEIEQRAAQVEYLVREAVRELLGMMTRVGRDLVVATAARMQTTTCRANRLGQVAFDGHVDILVVYVEIEVAFLNARGDGVKASANILGILFRNHALTGEHERMRLRSLDVGLPHALVNGKEAPKACVNSVGESSKRPPQSASFICVLSLVDDVSCIVNSMPSMSVVKQTIYQKMQC